MATFFSPPRYGLEYIFYTGLVSQAVGALLQANPTIVAGDVQIDLDGADDFTNLNTIPAVVGTTKSVKVTLSATEMKADNVSVLFSDAAGAEWADQLVNIQPSPMAAGIIRGTVDSTVTPTETVFESDDITEATGDQFLGRKLVFVISKAGTDALYGLSTDILDYALVSGRGRFTVTQLTEPPANNDEFVIV